ncbi:hypothetical protein BDB01DRAFT_788406 [Pilobolus umbonatus]|nr:hypothetical protein BDB01DRAFT_788406 [Pilobolus umbonatus]
MNTLPFEIIDIINTDLTPHDRLNCMYVCKSWASSFNRYFYEKIKFQSYGRFQLFHKAITTYPRCIKARDFIRSLTFRFTTYSIYDCFYIFHEVLALCTNVELLLFPDNPIWLYYMINSKTPELKALNVIRFDTSYSIPLEDLMACYYQHKSTLTHMFLAGEISKAPYCKPGNSISFITLFPNLTHLDIKPRFEPREQVDLFDKIIYHCPQLVFLSYSDIKNNSLAINDRPQVLHRSLVELEIHINIIYPDDIYYIKKKFPNLKTLFVDVGWKLHNESKSVKALMTLSHLLKLDIKALFFNDLEFKNAMLTFWEHSKPNYNLLEKNAVKEMSISSSEINHHCIKFSFGRNSRLKIGKMFLSVHADINESNQLEEYLDEVGSCLNKLTFQSSRENRISQLNIINKMCHKLNEVTLEMGDMDDFTYTTPSNPNVTRLTITTGLINNELFRIIEHCFPKLQRLKINYIEEDSLYGNSSKSNKENDIQLPRTGLIVLEIMQILNYHSNNIGCVVNQAKNNKTVCRWYYSITENKTVAIKDEDIENTNHIQPKDLYLSLTSSTLKKCILFTF